ncbi:N-acetylmuramoyl-L-alanine amidase [Gracilibacillus sp. S3-1-1]|uniref:N-acetylmuramoyl-L-alanine amidase n=1 Tax=Gracilibacillus pellucidus TaxID=3095368 RepID=A0ACC6M0B8_9BACI|nr:N-acetylmuramoyl-L-alanine amidase [Gracilibacillus sp. S3-1-1]MDX8044383.1 N-acetylmuramoyl-L-alanine amidase [Gracilibacillus sp. S3-1-1]
MKKIVMILFWFFVVFVIIASFKELLIDDEGMQKSEANSPLISSEVDVSSGGHVKVVIDPGHGGDDPGAIGASGSYEKDFTLSLSNKIVELLQTDPRLEVFMTREGDQFLSTETRERPMIANDLGADLFISIHANTYDTPTITGTETFYYNDYSESLAAIIHRHVVQATGYDDRGVKQANYFVLADTNMPAILIEVGYLTNPEQEQEMLTDAFQQNVAEAIVEGINEYIEQ